MPNHRKRDQRQKEHLRASASTAAFSQTLPSDSRLSAYSSSSPRYLPTMNNTPRAMVAPESFTPDVSESSPSNRTLKNSNRPWSSSVTLGHPSHRSVAVDRFLQQCTCLSSKELSGQSVVEKHFRSSFPAFGCFLFGLSFFFTIHSQEVKNAAKAERLCK